MIQIKDRQIFIFTPFFPRDFSKVIWDSEYSQRSGSSIRFGQRKKRTLSLSPFANVTQAFTLYATKTGEITKNFDHCTSEQGLFPH